MRLVLSLILAQAACHRDPPPIADGRCLADTWEGAHWPSSPAADRQKCVYQGYVWECEADRCTRMATESPQSLFPAEHPVK